MIVIDEIQRSGRTLVRTRSDAGRMIRQDGTGALYAEAVDPEGSGRTYTETDLQIQREEGTP